ncbi:MAG: hypothetical protein K2L59_09795 [Muribaculaceae bacterium]|nr:hypothetical protein [Muribaculaceae bacterium]
MSLRIAIGLAGHENTVAYLMITSSVGVESFHNSVFVTPCTATEVGVVIKLTTTLAVSIIGE